MKTLIEISIKGETLSLDLASIPDEARESIIDGLLGIGLKNTLQDASSAKGDAIQNRKDRLEKLLLGTYVFGAGGSRRPSQTVEQRATIATVLSIAKAFNFPVTESGKPTKKACTDWLGKRDPEKALFDAILNAKLAADPTFTMDNESFAKAKKALSFDTKLEAETLAIEKADEAKKRAALAKLEADKIKIEKVNLADLNF